MAKKSGDVVVGKKGLENKGLVIVLIILGLVIVGLIVGVVVVFNKSNNKIGYSCDVEVEDADAPMGERRQLAIVGKVRNTVDSMPSFDEGIMYLDEQIKCSENDDLKFQMKLIKFNYLVGNERTTEAIGFLSDVNIDSLNTKEKMQYYSTMRDIYHEMGNEEVAENYQELYLKEYFIYFDVGGLYE